jgi:hypothetical protein
MSEPPTKDAGLLGAVLTGLFGTFVGFFVGYLSVVVFIPFTDPQGETRKWLPDIAFLFGGCGASLGGLVGIITGAIFGFRPTVKGAATKGVIIGSAGIVVGFFAGFVASGLMDREWAIWTDGSTSGALLGGVVGVVIGTILGARKKVQP